MESSDASLLKRISASSSQGSAVDQNLGSTGSLARACAEHRWCKYLGANRCGQ